MPNKLNNKRVAILATDGYEESELTSPRDALQDAGAETVLISLKSGNIKGWKDGNWSNTVDVDITVDNADASDFDALVLPGGVINPDKLRTDDNVISFIRAFFKAGKPVAAICHGPWTLINAEVVKGRRLTSYHTIRKDLENAGAEWVDEECVCDQALVTSRSPADLPAFNNKLIEEVAEGIHAGQTA